MRILSALKSSLAIASLLLLVACSDRTSTPDAAIAGAELLRYVPADTPYILATLEPLPEDVYDKMAGGMDDMLAAYQVVLREAMRDAMTGAGEGGEIDPDAARVAALIERLAGMMSVEGMREAGIERDASFAVYGAGLTPVVRLELADAAAFEAAIAGFETEAGEKLPTATLDGLTYRHAGDDRVRVVLAVHEGQALLSLVPATLSDDSLRAVLGLTLPAESIVDSGRLQAVAKTNGFTAHMLGLVDIERLVATFLSPQSGANAELLAMAGFDSATLSDVCKAEIGGLAGVMPRIVTGYTNVTDTELASSLIVELRRDIADGLATLPAPVPGLGQDHGGLFSFGMSIDLLAAREFYKARLDAMEADPYQCELLGNLQAGVATGRAALNQPVPPVVYGIKGFLAIVDDLEGLDLATKQPPTSIDMRFLLATENAPGLVAMGTMFSPELAALNLQPDGKAVKLELPQMQQAPIEAAWVAMSQTAIALAVGEGGAGQASALLKNPAGAPPPFMSTHMDAGRYYGFIAEAMRMGEDAADKPEVSEAMSRLMQRLAELFDRIAVDIRFTDRGIVVPSVVTLAE